MGEGILWIDAQTCMSEVMARARAGHADFVVLYHGAYLYAFRPDELAAFENRDAPAYDVLGLEPSDASRRGGAVEPGDADPRAPDGSGWPDRDLGFLGDDVYLGEGAFGAPVTRSWVQRSAFRTVYVDATGRPIRVVDAVGVAAGRLRPFDWYDEADADDDAPDADDDVIGADADDDVIGADADDAVGVAAGRLPLADRAVRFGSRAPRLREPDDGGTSITRYPTIDATEPADPAADITLVIDLAQNPEEAISTDPIRFTGLPGDWTEFPVAVHVACPQLSFANGEDEGTIRVRRDQASVKCRLVGRRWPDRPGPLEVTATFFRGDRWCGTAQRTFATGAPHPTGAVAIALGALPPDLTVHIHRTDSDRKRLVWFLAPAAGHRDHVRRAGAESGLAEDPEPYIRGLFREAGGSRPGAHVALLQGIGERLWGLAPPAFHDAYWRMRGALGDDFTIQFITDEPYIPWELMRPLKDGELTRLLAETHPVARGLLAYPDRLRPVLPADGEIFTIAPDYAKRAQPALPPLAAAGEESAMLQARFRAIPIAPVSARRLIDIFADARKTRVRLLHFAGHGRAETPIDSSHLACEDGDVSIAQVRRQETRLGEDYRTFVILNACAAGAAGDVLGEVGGWAEAFAYCNFSGFIAPLWAVSDEHAKLAMESFFEEILVQGRPVGEALRDVRARYGQYSPTFLSYVYYGDVNARFKTSATRAAAPRPGEAPCAVESGRDEYGPWAAFEVAGVRQRLRWIPPGRFLMGSPKTELGRWDEEGPQHEVTLSRGYWLGETPVTQALWVAMMGENPSSFCKDRREDLERPVEFVSWDDCQRFLDLLNAQVAGLGARLPTEAEWERACRGGTGGATWVGELSGEYVAPELDAIAWYQGNSRGKTHPVGRKAANPYGLHDMLGNVFEWCADAGELAPYPAEAVTDPLAAGQGSYRVYRGGSWPSFARLVRAATRDALERGRRCGNLGFRLAGAIASAAQRGATARQSGRGDRRSASAATSTVSG